jgi:tetratricopeptide (TPR) repeat protein
MGSKWILPEEKAAVQEKAILIADQARDLLKQNKLKDAEAAIAKALAEDPTNVSALYLKGLILYRQDKVPEARKAFESVKEIMPDHGPTLNNLAVILWRQNQHVAALSVYDQAMQAMPLNKELLNNVAEALNALPEKDRSGQVPQKVYKRWNEQDVQLQQQLMQVGLYRWGSTWVDKATFDKVQAAEKEVKDKIAKLEEQFAEAQAKIDGIDARIRENHDAMNYMERSRYAQDATGRIISYPLPPQYWDYDRANRRLETQRAETLALIESLRAKAQAVKQQIPVPKYTGAMIMIGVEGTPLIAPADKTPANLKDTLIEPAEKSQPIVPDPAKLEPEKKPAKRPLDY